ncbi:MAG: aminotransferase class V-fold PLP-dependent enzyme [Clostridia bacterium]|nr:aminotransferase class V-fold PLP-dependent enzyme [Clostridia bacterium]
MIYLDNAASSHPKPASVLRAVARQIEGNGANPGRSGHNLAMKASQTVFSARKTLAKSFGTDPEIVIFTANTTDAINRALKGILKQGDHVVISDLEHNSVLRPLVALKERGIITFDVAKTERDDGKTLSNFSKCIRSETKLVFCTHASNVTGQILPIHDIGDLCRKMGILFGVDGAQTAGTESYDLQKDPIDLICVPGHKGLLGPQGTGALILSSAFRITPLFEGGTGSDSLSEHQPLTYPEGYESGTLNTPGIAGMEQGVLYTDRHKDEIRAREATLKAIFLEELKKLSAFRILGDTKNSVATVSLVHPRDHSEKIAEWLNRCGICTRGGYHCSALAHRALNTVESGAVRISFGYRNTVKEAVECVKCLKKYQKYFG